MNYPQKSPPGPGGINQERKYISHYTGKNYPVNPYIQNLEKTRLVRMMRYGKPIRFKHSFTDTRHRFIYSWLENFLGNYPISQFNAEWFIYYLSEMSGAIEQAGGEGYIRDIFRNIEGAGNG